ncbi:MAG: hypothetical protein WKG07_03010 [Hymenobacter sp.]
MLQSTRQQMRNNPIPMPLQAVTKKGGQEEAISLVLPGDSAIFRFAADSLFPPAGAARAEARRQRAGSAHGGRAAGE